MDWFNKKKEIDENAHPKGDSKPVDCKVCKTEEALKLRFMRDYTRYKNLLDQIEVGKPFYIEGNYNEFVLEKKPILLWEDFYESVKRQAVTYLRKWSYAPDLAKWTMIVAYDSSRWEPSLIVDCLCNGQSFTIDLRRVSNIHHKFIDVVPENIRSIEAIQKDQYRRIQWVWVKVLITKGFYTQEEIDGVSRKMSARECKKLMLGEQFDGDGIHIQKVLNGYVHFTQGGNAVMVISDDEMSRLAE